MINSIKRKIFFTKVCNLDALEQNLKYVITQQFFKWWEDNFKNCYCFVLLKIVLRRNCDVTKAVQTSKLRQDDQPSAAYLVVPCQRTCQVQQLVSGLEALSKQTNMLYRYLCTIMKAPLDNVTYFHDISNHLLARGFQ